MKPIGYFASGCPAIEKFAHVFEKADNRVTLSDNDKAALIAVLAQHAWGLKSGLEDDFGSNVENAIGDGVETTLETEDPTAPLQVALDILAPIRGADWCYGLIAYFVQ